MILLFNTFCAVKSFREKKEDPASLNQSQSKAESLKLNATLFPLHLTQNSVSVFCVYNNNAVILKRFKKWKIAS